MVTGSLNFAGCKAGMANLVFFAPVGKFLTIFSRTAAARENGVYRFAGITLLRLHLPLRERVAFRIRYYWKD